MRAAEPGGNRNVPPANELKLQISALLMPEGVKVEKEEEEPGALVSLQEDVQPCNRAVLRPRSLPPNVKNMDADSRERGFMGSFIQECLKKPNNSEKAAVGGAPLDWQHRDTKWIDPPSGIVQSQRCCNQARLLPEELLAEIRKLRRWSNAPHFFLEES